MVLGQIFAAQGKDLKDRYILRVIPNGYQYFVVPFILENPGNKSQSGQADITYLSYEEDLTMNVSAYSPTPLDIDSVVILSAPSKRIVLYPREDKHLGNIAQTEPTNSFTIFFVEKEKKHWHHRISCRFAIDDLRTIYRAKQPYQIQIFSEQGKLCLQVPPKKWAQEQKDFTDILFIFNKNK